MEMAWRTIKALILIGILGWFVIWLIGKMAYMGEASDVYRAQPNGAKSAQEIMRPDPIKRKGW